jgi:hypothetical protein
LTFDIWFDGFNDLTFWNNKIIEPHNSTGLLIYVPLQTLCIFNTSYETVLIVLRWKQPSTFCFVKSEQKLFEILFAARLNILQEKFDLNYVHTYLYIYKIKPLQLLILALLKIKDSALLPEIDCTFKSTLYNVK